MSSEITRHAAGQLRAVMGVRRMTVASLAELLGVTPKTAARLSRGDREWTLAHLGEVSQLMGIPVAELLGISSDEAVAE